MRGGERERGRKGREGQGMAGQAEVLAGEWEQLFTYVTHCIKLIHIALGFHEDIP